MAALSSFLANKIIDHMLRNQAYTPATTVYVALFTAVTGLATNNPTAEVSGNAYARTAVTLDAASGGVTANTAAVAFTEATGDWGTVTHFAVVDHATNTTWGTNVNVLTYGALSASRIIGQYDVPTFAIGDLDITLV